MKWGYQDNFKPIYLFIFIFFYEKISCAQKHSQANINQQNKIKKTLNKKCNNFSQAQKLLRGWKSFVLRLVVFVRLKPFRKKINRLEFVLITSFYYTTNKPHKRIEQIDFNKFSKFNKLKNLLYTWSRKRYNFAYGQEYMYSLFGSVIPEIAVVNLQY